MSKCPLIFLRFHKFLNMENKYIFLNAPLSFSFSSKKVKIWTHFFSFYMWAHQAHVSVLLRKKWHMKFPLSRDVMESMVSGWLLHHSYYYSYLWFFSFQVRNRKNWACDVSTFWVEGWTSASRCDRRTVKKSIFQMISSGNNLKTPY